MYKIKKINEKNVYYSDLANVEHFFTTRDLPIRENFDLICEYLNIETKDLIRPSQVHSCNIEVVKEDKYEYHEIQKALCGKVAEENNGIWKVGGEIFTPIRIRVIQMN